MSRLLTYLWEHQADDISEYANFDAAVRVQIGRLRQLMDKYCATEGVQQIRRLMIPSASHQPTIVEVAETPALRSPFHALA